jgi:hypothetical protein
VALVEEPLRPLQVRSFTTANSAISTGEKFSDLARQGPQVIGRL